MIFVLRDVYCFFENIILRVFIDSIRFYFFVWKIIFLKCEEEVIWVGYVFGNVFSRNINE